MTLPAATALAARPPVPPWWRTAGGALAAVGVSAALAVLWLATTLVERADGLAIARGARVVAEVVSTGGGRQVLVEYGVLRRSVTVDVAQAGDYVVGRRYPARVDPVHPDRVRFAREPYEPLDTVFYGVVPLAISLGFAVWDRWRWHRVLAVSRGPWRALETWALPEAKDTVVLAVPGARVALATVRVGGWLPSRAVRLQPSAPISVAGDPQPGGIVAILTSDGVLPVARPAGAAPALAWWRFSGPSRDASPG